MPVDGGGSTRRGKPSKQITCANDPLVLASNEKAAFPGGLVVEQGWIVPRYIRSLLLSEVVSANTGKTEMGSAGAEPVGSSAGSIPFFPSSPRMRFLTDSVAVHSRNPLP